MYHLYVVLNTFNILRGGHDTWYRDPEVPARMLPPGRRITEYFRQGIDHSDAIPHKALSKEDIMANIVDCLLVLGRSLSP
jgi:hypothetical protein